MYMTRSSRRQMKFCYLQSKHNLFIHLMLGSNIVFKSEATRWLSKWWTSRRMADKVTKLTISLFLLFQCCEYFGPKHFPSEVFATCMSSGSIARFFIICLLQLHIIDFIFITSFMIIFTILILLRIVDTMSLQIHKQ